MHATTILSRAFLPSPVLLPFTVLSFRVDSSRSYGPHNDRLKGGVGIPNIQCWHYRNTQYSFQTVHLSGDPVPETIGAWSGTPFPENVLVR